MRWRGASFRLLAAGRFVCKDRVQSQIDKLDLHPKFKISRGRDSSPLS